ncbi:MAG: mechanosensitive ion channel [Chitinophagaceae bacterium]|nr:MAG: mechanosensitive ion channel [Chitinophagaceae bacterium]
MRKSRGVLLMVILSLLCADTLVAQDSLRRFPDSTRRSDTSRRRPRDLQLFTDTAALTSSDYQLRIENTYNILGRIHDKSELGPQVRNIRDNLSYSDSSLAVLQDNILHNNQALNMRNLQTFRTLLVNIIDETAGQRLVLEEKEKELKLLQTDMKTLIGDTVIRSLMRDSAQRATFAPQLREMRSAWRESTTGLRHSLNTINQLQLHNSRNSISSVSLLEKVDDLISQSLTLVFSKEINYLWERAPDSLQKDSDTAISKAVNGESKALDYYFREKAAQRILLILLGLLFGFWCFRNQRRIRKADPPGRLKNLGIQFLYPFYIASPLVLLFTVAPLFDLKAPSAYVEGMQLLLLLTVTWICWRKWPLRLCLYWTGLGILFIILSVTQHLLQPGTGARIFLMLMNVLSILLGSLFLRGMRDHLQMKGFLKFVIILHNVMNVLALLCNIFGRFSLAQILGNAAIFSLTQAVGLAIFSRICMEAILLQVEAGRVKQGAREVFDYADIYKGFRGPISFLVITLWIIVFTTNLNFYHAARELFLRLMSQPRIVGSASFTVGGVVLFFLIIWIAHILQKYVGYFFGDTGTESLQDKRKRSRLLMAKLLVLCFGYLLAVAASGLPVDKITIVLGALGVGIGLGLQNLVNNFVSGILLIFDRPFQVGDAISIADKEGTVREIGLRSTTLLTDDGAEVIIPNGDILSLHITNWTLSNNQQRLGITIELTGAVDIERITAVLKKAVGASGFAVEGTEPEIIFAAVQKDQLQIQAWFWCKDMHDSDEAKSSVIRSVYEQLGPEAVSIR